MTLHVGLMETDMTAAMRAPKVAPDEVAARALDGLEAGAYEVLADEPSRRVRGALGADLAALYPSLA